MWNFMAVMLFCAGLASVFRYKEKNHLASLYSTHSWLGIFTVVLVFAQFLIGFCTYALPGITMLTKQRVYPLHSAIGLASTVTAVAAVLSGIDHENTLLGCAYSVR
jgi:cytochrome b-561